MAIRSQKQTYDRMTSEKTVNGMKSSYGYSDLSNLKKRIDRMYEYRNDNIRDIDGNYNPVINTFSNNDNTPGYIQNICNQHYYKSFKEFQQERGVDYSLSLGDLNDALDAISYCTCNGRSTSGCACVQRNTGDYCACHTRAPYNCYCVYRSGGKYDSNSCEIVKRSSSPSCFRNVYSKVCQCHIKYVGSVCSSRSANISCDCNNRCSCNVVNEFSMEPTVTTCTCVSRQLGDFCRCHGRTQQPIVTYGGHVDSCFSHYDKQTEACDCVNRTSTVHCQYHMQSY